MDCPFYCGHKLIWDCEERGAMRDWPVCPNCITKPQLVQVKANIFTCPVCDLMVAIRRGPDAPRAA